MGGKQIAWFFPPPHAHLCNKGFWSIGGCVLVCTILCNKMMHLHWAVEIRYFDFDVCLFIFTQAAERNIKQGKYLSCIWMTVMLRLRNNCWNLKAKWATEQRATPRWWKMKNLDLRAGNEGFSWKMTVKRRITDRQWRRELKGWIH